MNSSQVLTSAVFVGILCNSSIVKFLESQMLQHIIGNRSVCFEAKFVFPIVCINHFCEDSLKGDD